MKIWPLNSCFLLFSLPDPRSKCRYSLRHKSKDLCFHNSQEEFYHQLLRSQNSLVRFKYSHFLVIPLSLKPFTVKDKTVFQSVPVKERVYFKSRCSRSAHFYFTMAILHFVSTENSTHHCSSSSALFFITSLLKWQYLYWHPCEQSFTPPS